MYSASQNLFYLLLLLLLLSRPPGTVPFIIKVPTDYMALQGHLIVHLVFPKEEKEKNSSDKNESNKIFESFRKINDSSLEEPSGYGTEAAPLESFLKNSKSLDNPAEFEAESSLNKENSFINSFDSFVESHVLMRGHQKHFKNKIKAFSNQQKSLFQSYSSNNVHDVINSTLDAEVKSNSDLKERIKNQMNIWESPQSSSPNDSSSSSSSSSPSSSSSSSSSSSLTSTMFISLYILHQKKPLMRLKVPPEGNQTTFIFPCGTVANGGLHVVRLKQNKKIIAESQKFNVSWPHMVIDIPIRLETYRSPADIQFSFIKAHSCSSTNPKAFKTWAELLYHGSESPRITPTRMPTSMLQEIFDNGEEQRNKRSFVHPLIGENINFEPSSSSSKTQNNSYNDVDKLRSDIQLSDNSGSFEHRSTYSDNIFNKTLFKNSSDFIIPLTLRPKRMYTLSSLEGSTIPSKSNSNIKPEALKRWSWENRTNNVQVVQRVPVMGDLYAQAEFNVRFSCEVVGPAGLYSVRVVTDIPSNPVIAESNTFPVDWAEEFTLNIQRLNLIPCMSPVLVTYTRPICVGKQEKIRLYAQVRANVTSANPPIYQRYITERRATNHSIYFDCDLFTDEPTEYCFLYVNTATSGAVSVARTQCVATFKPGVLRIDGEWGEWSHWTKCTTTCGSGTKIRHRFCNNPPPRNGGLFCQGQSLSTTICGDPTCVEVPLPVTIPSSALPPFGHDNECLCGCYLSMEKDFEITLSPSAADCTGTSTWIFEGPMGTVISGELLRAALLPGFQWLKVRDGNSSSSPLLLALPSFRSSMPHKVQERVTSSTRILLVKFRSDVNSSFIGNVWGFRLKVWASSPVIRRLVWSALEVSIKRNIAAFHVVIIILGSCVLIAITGYLAYYCRRYHDYKSKLIVDDSPMETPDGSPVHDSRRVMISSAASVATFTEVLSMKSLKLSLRKSSSSSYTRLAREGDFGFKGVGPILRSLPASPMLSLSRLPLSIRRSSTQLTRILKMGNRKKINRRSASFDHLRSNISPIDEDISLPNSLTMEHLNINLNSSDKKVYIEQEKKIKQHESETGEDNSDKYKEYRKSLLMSKDLRDKVEKIPEFADISKQNKDKVNKDKINKEILNNRKDVKKESTKDTISSSSRDEALRPSSSVSQLSVTSGLDMEMEIDYYDYDVGNASAVPGSLFGMDPTLMPWVIDIDDLDIKSLDELANETNRSTPVNDPEYLNSSALISDPILDLTPRREQIPLQLLNISSTSTDILHQSSTSNESNGSPDHNKLHVYTGVKQEDEVDNDEEELTPRVELQSSTSGDNIKILNIHEVDDFQFADDSEEDFEDIIYNKG